MSEDPTYQLRDWDEADLAPALEALLLSATEPMPAVVLAEAAQAPTELVERVLDELADFYTTSGRGFQLRRIGGGWQYATRPEHHELISRWVIEGQQNRLTQAALETLAVIAYLQPVSRARVSGVRGVNVDGVVRTLLARDLIAEDGHDEITGAATLRTTEYFLQRLGLADLDELPDLAPYLPDATALEAELSELAAPGEPDEGASNE